MGDRIKVLSVSTSDSSGGAARAAYRIHLAVQESGVESRMFVKHKRTTDDAVVPLRDFVPRNALYKAFDWVRNKAKNKWQHFLWGRYPDRSVLFMSDLRSTDIHGALRKLDYDVLHLHWINQRFLPLDALPKDKPIVWTLHDSWPFCGVCHLPMDCGGYLMECGYCLALRSQAPHDLSHAIWTKKSKIYQSLDLHIVAPSQWIAGCARKSSLLGRCDIRVIPNCIDVEAFSPGDRVAACEYTHLDPKKKYLLFGAMNALRDDNKGFRFLVNALRSISSQLPDGTELVVFGSNDAFDKEIDGIRVVDMGVITDSRLIVSLYRAAEVAIVPSLSENLSCTIMESLSCGTPAVAFNIGGNGDLIEHGVNGYLAQEQDEKDLAQGILWCMEHNQDGLLSQNARRKVMENYTPEDVGSRYANLYRSLTES